MALFTFILDYNGGTYIHQIKARSLRIAPVKWASTLEESEIPGFGKQGKKQLILDLQNDEPVGIQGTSNVWCISALVRGKLALINIVATVDSK